MDEKMFYFFLLAIVGILLVYKYLAGSNRGRNRDRNRDVGRVISQESGANNRRLVPASRDNITETGLMIYYANDRHNQDDKEYRFNYKKVGSGWRAYIVRMPSLGARSYDSTRIHRLHDSNGYYICWNRQVNTLKDMQTISRRWADSIQEYKATGRFGV